MRPYNKLKRLFYVGLSSLLGLGLSACGPTPSSSATLGISEGPAKITSISEKASQCETQLRSQMEARKILFTPVPGLETTITEANQAIALPGETKYMAEEGLREIQAIKIQHTKKLHSVLTYSISKAPSTSDQPLSFKTEIKIFKAGQSTTLMQKYQVDQNCGLEASETYEEDLKKTSSTQYSFTKKTFFTDGESQSKIDSFTLPEKAVLVDVDPLYDSPEKYVDGAFSYDSSMGLYQIRIASSPLEKLTYFGLSLTLAKKNIELYTKDKKFLSLTMGRDENFKIDLTTVQKRKSWTLPRKIWQDLSVGASRALSDFIDFQLPTGYLKSNNSILLLGKSKPDYENFSAYWNITSTAKQENTGVLQMVLTENPKFSAPGSINPADLISNSTIQTDHPPIQVLAGRILKQTADRGEQAQLILNFLAQNYTYDREMLKKNVIRPLTTAEALDRKKGVCQHYAVIFTAAARALKIPTRIVFGYLLDSPTPSPHAWVESELVPGQWQVIEPQNPKSLDSLQARYYLPISRAYDLEDKNEAATRMLEKILSVSYTLKPALSF